MTNYIKIKFINKIIELFSKNSDSVTKAEALDIIINTFAKNMNMMSEKDFDKFITSNEDLYKSIVSFIKDYPEKNKGKRFASISCS